jgi:hypothetical protein
MFLVGIGVGILGYSAVYAKIASFATSGGGERKFLTDWLGLGYGTVTVLVTLMAIGMFVGAEFLERKMANRMQKPEPPAPGTDGSTSSSAESAVSAS